MSTPDSDLEEYEKLHAEACKRGASFYLDPKSGYQVSTKLFLLLRKQCCESGCRHCPYGFHEKKKGPSEEDDPFEK